MSDEITVVQQKTLGEIQNFIAKTGYPPTVGELAQQMKKTKAATHGVLDKLIRNGFIRRKHGKARSIEIIRTPRTSVVDVVPIPIMGTVPAGAPISAEEQRSESIYIQATMVGSTDCFALCVTGDSMECANIRDGDVVVVQPVALADNGEIVVASVDGEVTLKRLSIEDGNVQLVPENPKYRPIEIAPGADIKILGRVIATRRVKTTV